MTNTPQFKSPPLPSIECFKLDNILNTSLVNESNQVISDVLNITNNYQQDLAQGIKTNLIIEQKIQSKNVDVVKLSHGLNTQVKHRVKKLSKVNNPDPDDVNQLLRNTIIVSEKAKLLVEKLHEIEMLVNGNASVNPVMYPNISKILQKLQKQKQNVLSTPPTESPKSLDPIERELQFEQVQEGQYSQQGQYLQQVQQVQLPESPESPESPVSDSESCEIIPYSPVLPIHNPPELSKEMLPDSDEIMNPDQFELFMSDSISKYRHQKSLKYKQSSQPTKNPLNLLYSQLIPKNSEQFLKSPYPFAKTITMKSTPIINTTLQTSHFKKLRINGDPIGSTRNDACGCISPNQSEHELALQEEDEEIDWPGLTFDEEELTDTDSSESDSDDDSNSLPMITNQYYTNLKKAHTRKRKVKQQQQQQQLDISRTKKPTKKTSPPTPKHKPSHHTLKPKRSILKTSDPIIFSKENSPYRRAINATNIIPDAVAIVNHKYASKIEYPISEVTANGVILEQPLESEDTDDCHSIRSISVLKNYI